MGDVARWVVEAGGGGVPFVDDVADFGCLDVVPDFVGLGGVSGVGLDGVDHRFDEVLSA